MRFYLTTPIYYVNATPTIGNAYTTAIGDMLVRHQQQRGADTFFLTGVDEHATKVWRVAQEQGLEAQEYADRIAVPWRELHRSLNADVDFFIRTSDDGHKRFVRSSCSGCTTTATSTRTSMPGFTASAARPSRPRTSSTEDGLCPDHLVPPEWIEEKNYFFRLSAYQDQLLALYDERPDLVLPDFRFNEARSFIAGGLRDFSISRAGQPWGIPLPWDESQVAYVWADALVNYVSALTYARPGEDLRDRYWPVVHHVLGKDILRFHCVYWPAMLLSAGYEPPQQLFVHGYLLLDDRKISKSAGNAIDPLDLIGVYGVDAVRYWMARAISFGQDGSASIEGIRERYDNELANDLGNLLSRTTAMVAQYREGSLRQGDAESPLDLKALGDDVAERMDRFDVTGALDAVWEGVRALNQYVTVEAPWQLAKDAANDARLDGVLYNLVDGLTALAVALGPFLPATAPRILEALRQPADLAWDRVRNGVAEEVDGIAAAKPLFPRIELPATAA